MIVNLYPVLLQGFKGIKWFLYSASSIPRLVNAWIQVENISGFVLVFCQLQLQETDYLEFIN